MRQLLCSFGLVLGLLAAVGQSATAMTEAVPAPPERKPQVDAASLPPPLRSFDLLSEHDWTLYRTAFERFRAGQTDHAIALAKQAENPYLIKVLRWMDMIRPDSDRDFTSVSAFIAANPHWPRQTALRSQAERRLPTDWSSQQVIAWFAGEPPTTVEGHVRLIRALKRSLRERDAVALAREAWVELDFTVAEEAAFRREFGAALRREDFVARLHRLLWDRRTSTALTQAKRLGGGWLKLAQARIALYRRQPGVDGAIARVPADLRDDPGLIYDRALWRQRAGLLEGVVELIDRDLGSLPHAERWWSLREWAARQSFEAGSYDVAYRLAAAHGVESGLAFAEGEWLAGWLALRFLDRPEVAYRHFARLHDGVTTPISLARGAYWAGEAARAMGRTDWATRWYEIAAQHFTVFYGQLAAQRLDRPLPARWPDWPVPTPREREAFADKELVRIAALLGEVGETDLQSIFLLRLRLDARTATDYALLAELAVSLDRRDQALRTAKDARDAGILLPDLLFPELPHRLDERPEPALVYAVIRQESEFYRLAQSHAGARGMMQLLPSTAKGVARKLGIPYSLNRLSEDPLYNVTLGRSYLDEMLRRFDGSYVLALAAYNAGPSRAARWRRELGDPHDPAVDMVDWIESLPFGETRNYIQRILESLAVYRLRQPDQQHPPVISIASTRR